MAISPSGMDYFSTTPEDVVITDLEANIVDGVRKPSSEWAPHAFYRHKPPRQGRGAHPLHVLHHLCRAGPAPSGCPLCNRRHRSSHRPLRAVPPLRHSGAGRGRHRPAAAATPFCWATTAWWACGRDLKSAYGLACNLEYVAELQYRTMCIGTPNILTDEQMAEVMERFRSYGQPGSGKAGY